MRGEPWANACHKTVTRDVRGRLQGMKIAMNAYTWVASVIDVRCVPQLLQTRGIRPKG
jgi:hypothetical protein